MSENIESAFRFCPVYSGSSGNMLFAEGGGARVSEQLTESLGYDVPLLAQLPLEPELRETGEAGRPAVLNEDGSLRADDIGETFRNLAESLMRRPL